MFSVFDLSFSWNTSTRKLFQCNSSCSIFLCPRLQSTILVWSSLVWSILHSSVQFNSIQFSSIQFSLLHSCTVLSCPAIFCSIPLSSILFCSVQFCSAIYCSPLLSSVLSRSVLSSTALFCPVLSYSIPSWRDFVFVCGTIEITPGNLSSCSLPQNFRLFYRMLYFPQQVSMSIKFSTEKHTNPWTI